MQHTASPRFFPFFSVSAVANIAHVGGLGRITVQGESIDLRRGATEGTFVLKPEAGIKYFVARNVSFDVAYNLLYARIDGLGFKDSTASLITFGLAYTF